MGEAAGDGVGAAGLVECKVRPSNITRNPRATRQQKSIQSTYAFSSSTPDGATAIPSRFPHARFVPRGARCD
eukprot:5026471-Amphidinium_carterae.1